MADGISNISNTEQLVVCTRWIDDDLNSQEEFIELHLSEITNDDITAKMIKDILLHMNIFLSKFTVDGCSTTKDQKARVAKQIKDIEQKALLIFCYTYSLHLAASDAIKNSEIIKALKQTHEITKLIKKSPKKVAKLDAIKNEVKIISNTEEDHMEAIILLWSTRLTVCAKSLSSIMSNYSYLKELW